MTMSNHAISLGWDGFPNNELIRNIEAELLPRPQNQHRLHKDRKHKLVGKLTVLNC